MRIKWTVWCTFQTNNYTFIRLHTNNILGLIVSEFSVFNRLIVWLYNLDTMNSYKIISNVIAIGLQNILKLIIMIMRSKTGLRNYIYVAFSCYYCIDGNSFTYWVPYCIIVLSLSTYTLTRQSRITAESTLLTVNYRPYCSFWNTVGSSNLFATLCWHIKWYH